jgi:hypothetical protein
MSRGKSRGRAHGEVTMSVECHSIDSESGRNAREVSSTKKGLARTRLKWRGNARVAAATGRFVNPSGSPNRKFNSPSGHENVWLYMYKA